MAEVKTTSSNYVSIRPSSAEMLRASAAQDPKQTYFHVAGLPEPRIDPWSMFYNTAHPSPYCTNPYYRDVLPFGLYSFAPLYSLEEEKPAQSYIGLIAQAILNSSEKKLILGDIYNYILAHYPYFRNKGTGWRNSVRHNLSLNPCFVKADRSPNGKGHYWAINSEFYDDFVKGNFRRRKVSRKGKAGAEEKEEDAEKNDSENTTESCEECTADKQPVTEEERTDQERVESTLCRSGPEKNDINDEEEPPCKRKRVDTSQTKTEKRGFDVASLLAVTDIKKEKCDQGGKGVYQSRAPFSSMSPQTTWTSLGQGYSAFTYPPKSLPLPPMPYSFAYHYSTRSMYGPPHYAFGQNVF